MENFAQTLRNYFENDPDQVSIILQKAGERDQILRYRDLVEGAAAYAETYSHQGIEPGEVVVLILQFGPDLVYAFWGAVLHGAIPAILPFLTEKLTPERYLSDLASLISVTRPSAVVTYPDFEGTVNQAMEDSSVRSVIISDRVKKDVEPEFGSWTGLDRSPEDIAILQHSSGTTGLQKGVALSHRAVFNQLEALGEAINLDPESDTVVSWLPLYHDMGLIACFVLPVLCGVPLVLMSPFDWVRAPQSLMQAVSEYQGTLAWLPNFAYNFCARKIRDRHLEGVDLSSWRAIINCSEPVRWESHQAFFDKFKEYGLRRESLQTSYAMAENTFGVTQSELGELPPVEKVDQELFVEERVAKPADDGDPAVHVMSSGVPLKNTEIRVQDEEGGVVDDGVVGEIAIYSDCMLTGYYHRPDVTAQSFQGKWFLTGDFGYISNGDLFVTGRKKDLIIVGGKNIYPRDLEELVYEVPGVHPGRASVFGVFNERLGTEDVVVVAESDLQDQEERYQLANEIRKHVTKHSPIALRIVEIVDPKWIVKTSSGKISRKANKEKYLEQFS